MRGESEGYLTTGPISPGGACQESISFRPSLRETEAAWKREREMSFHPICELGGWKCGGMHNPSGALDGSW